MIRAGANGTARRPILHIVPAAFDRERGVLGGAERYALGLARAMAGIAPTILLTFGDRFERRRDGPLEVVMERASFVRGQRQNPWSWAIARWVARARVVHCHQRAIVASSAAALLGRIAGRPVFVTDLGGGGFDVSGFVDTSRWFAGHLHISEFSRRVYGHAGREDAVVIGGGVDTALFAPDPAVARDGSVLFVGRILPHKGVNDLIEAAPRDAPVRILGMAYDGRYLEDLRRMAAGKRVEFMHGVSDEALVRAYRAAAVAVVPSVYRTIYGEVTPVPELLGQTALEAMACGTPVVCTDVGSLPEVVLDGETGFVVPPNDPAALRERIGRLLARPAEAERMGAAGRRRVIERFVWSAVARRCMEAYEARGRQPDGSATERIQGVPGCL